MKKDANAGVNNRKSFDGEKAPNKLALQHDSFVQRTFIICHLAAVIYSRNGGV